MTAQDENETGDKTNVQENQKEEEEGVSRRSDRKHKQKIPNSDFSNYIEDEDAEDDDGSTKKKRRRSATQKKKPSINDDDDGFNENRRRKKAIRDVKVVEYNGKEVKMSLNNCCHQCKRNDKEEVVRCLNCGTKRFCKMCRATWYYSLSLF